MAVTEKRKSRAEATTFQSKLSEYVQAYNDGEIVAIKTASYKKWDDDKGFFIVVDEDQDITGSIWVHDTSVPDRFRTSAGKEVTLLSENGEETIEVSSRGMRNKLYFFFDEVGTVEVKQEDGSVKTYLDLDNEHMKPLMFSAEDFEAAMEIVIAD